MPNAKPISASAKSRGGSRAKAVAGSVLNPTKAARPPTGEFKLVLPPRTRKTLWSHKAQVKALMEVLGETIEESQKSGRASGFRVEVDQTGRPRILPANDVPSPAGSSADADDDELERALDAARERGRLRAAEILSGEDMLSADDFAELLGVSRVTVNAKRQKHEVLALDGAKRGFRFPAWQIDENGKPFGAMPKLFEHLGDSPWAVYRFLVQRHPALGGVRGVDALRRGRAAEAISTAESIARGDFS
jgi:hypothetical protein